ncbi:DUF4214 domain-containing protein [Desulfonatronum parangueonense]
MKQGIFYSKHVLVLLLCLFIVGLNSVRAEAGSSLQHFEQVRVNDLSDWESYIDNDGAFEIQSPGEVVLTAEEQSYADMYKPFEGAVGVTATIDINELSGPSRAGIRISRLANSIEGNRIDSVMFIYHYEGEYNVSYVVIDRVSQEPLCEGFIPVHGNPLESGIQLGIARKGHEMHFIAAEYGTETCILNEDVDFSLSPFYLVLVDAEEGRADALFRDIHILYPEPEPQGLTDAQWISSFYAAYWGRAGDPDGLSYWLGRVSQGIIDVPGVAENFALSDEAKAMYPYFNSPETATDAERTAFVRAVYRNLLNRDVPGDDAGLVYWVQELRSDNTTPGAVIGHIIHAAIQLDGEDWAVVWNKIQAAEYFTQRFEASGRMWQESDLNLAGHALDYIQGDPATLVSAKVRIDQFFQQFDGEPLTPTTILGEWNFTEHDGAGTMVFMEDGRATGTIVLAEGTGEFSGTWELVGDYLTFIFDDDLEIMKSLVFGTSERFTYHTSENPLTFTRP